jgi:hypothetical protein
MKKNTIINYQDLWDRIKEYAMKVGRVAVRPVLLLYYVMRSEDTPWKDKLTIFLTSAMRHPVRACAC